MIALPMGLLRAVATAFLPDAAAIARYVETSTPDGVEHAWQTVAVDVPCSVTPSGTTATERTSAAGATLRGVSEWLVRLPAETDVTTRDRITVTGNGHLDGRTFEINRVDVASYEADRRCICTLIE